MVHTTVCTCMQFRQEIIFFFPSTNIDSEALSIHLRLWSISALHAETAVEYSPGSLVTFSIVFVWVHVCTVFTHMVLCWYFVETYSGLFSIFPQLFPSDLWSDRWIKNCLHYYLDFLNLPCISFCFLYILDEVALSITCTVRCKSISSLQAVHRSHRTQSYGRGAPSTEKQTNILAQHTVDETDIRLPIRQQINCCLLITKYQF